MFKNENEVVVTRAKKKYKKAQEKRSESGPSRNSELQENALATATELRDRTDLHNLAVALSTPAKPLSFDPRFQGLSIFLSKHTSRQGPASALFNHFDFLPALLSQTQHHPDSSRILLETSITAAGLASLASSTNSPRITSSARAEYSKALRLTNTALQSVDTAKQSSTLVSIIMLCLYEKFLFEDQGAPARCLGHVQGASTLITMWGDDMLSDPWGHRIWRQFVLMMLLIPAQAGMKAHKGVWDIWRKHTPTEDVLGWEKNWIARRLVGSIRAAMDVCRETDAVETVMGALECEEMFEELFALVPGRWDYGVVEVRDTGVEKEEFRLPTGRYHIYQEPWIVEMYNNAHAVRIQMHQALCANLDAAARLAPEHFPPDVITEQKHRSQEIMRLCADAICASVPQLLGQIPFPTSPGRTNPLRSRAEKRLQGPTATISKPPPSPSPSTSDISEASSRSGSPQSTTYLSLRPRNTQSWRPVRAQPSHPSATTPTFADLFDANDEQFKRKPRGTYAHGSPSLAPGMLQLFWPLNQAAKVEREDRDEVRKWAAEVMTWLGLETGSRQAFMLARVLSGEGECWCY
ncbi:hypothetical protein M011DRAFT_465306 [Sporormia fimetaria CBS 119925]|uniref:Uncharacterized protein n=1 Tax=Sporormia fimetaria CBS 119925 TaxID=1340428 RepID=A0A6A6VII4_9PLEO|nr:hypothetical protein M011DRAFT_465306 [Sporormia fimetaria CBS 119925]